jgi:hypothetical protein
MAMKQQVAPLKDVLGNLAALYSPIKSKCVDYRAELILTFLVESNSRIFVQEDGVWCVKGRFSHAVLLREQLPWQQDEKGKVSISLLAVCHCFIPLFCHSSMS